MRSQRWRCAAGRRRFTLRSMSPARARSSVAHEILYGVDEDAHGHPTVPPPIELAGVRERIANVVTTSISEPLTIVTREYPLPSDAARGYVEAARGAYLLTPGLWP